MSPPSDRISLHAVTVSCIVWPWAQCRNVLTSDVYNMCGVQGGAGPTNFTEDFSGRVDHLFAATATVTPGVGDAPNGVHNVSQSVREVAAVELHRGVDAFIPHEAHPSDHIPLVVDWQT